MRKLKLLNPHRRIRELFVRPMSLAEVCRWVWTALLLSALAQPIAAQIPGTQAQKSEPAQKSESSAQPATDPLGRSTPRGTLMGFLRAVEKNDASAVRYLEVTAGESQQALDSARDLRNLIDRYLKVPLAKVSDSPDGTLNEGLPTNRERVGPLVMGDRTADITLVRVTDPQAGPIWLISSQTLAEVPSWSRSLAQSSTEQSWIERWMPKALLSHDVFGLSVAHWIVLVVTLLIPFALLVLTFSIAIRLIRATVREPSRLRSINAWYAGMRLPLIIFLTLSIQLIWMLLRMRSLGFTLTSRVTYARVALVLDVIALAWVLRKFLTLRLRRTRRLLMEKDRTGTESLVLLGERLLRALVFLVAVFAILAIVGVNTKTALAGLGIGGIALALGAQRTVENLLGGILLLSDKALAIGDFCSISNRVGVVEDITLRSVRLRTLDRTLVSIPAGALAQSGIENFATREKILVQSTLRLRYGAIAANSISRRSRRERLCADKVHLRARFRGGGHRACEHSGGRRPEGSTAGAISSVRAAQLTGEPSDRAGKSLRAGQLPGFQLSEAIEVVQRYGRSLSPPWEGSGPQPNAGLASVRSCIASVRGPFASPL